MLVLTFQIGNERLAVDIRHVREVLPRVKLHSQAGAPAWLAGLFVYRGRVVPVIDLHRLLGAGECPPHLSSRIILVPWSADGQPPARAEDAPLVGLLAAQVADIREVSSPRLGAHNDRGQALLGHQASAAPGLGTTLVEGGSILHLLDVGRLLPQQVNAWLRDALPQPGRLTEGP